MICECGNKEFFASQVCRVTIVVDENDSFLRNTGPDDTPAIDSADDPYGPYECTKCGKVYDGS